MTDSRRQTNRGTYSTNRAGIAPRGKMFTNSFITLAYYLLKVAVWCSGNTLVSINEVNLR